MPAQTTGYYTEPAAMTAAGDYTPLLADLPRGVAALAGVAHGLLIHEHIADAYGVTLTDERRASSARYSTGWPGSPATRTTGSPS